MMLLPPIEDVPATPSNLGKRSRTHEEPEQEPCDTRFFPSRPEWAGLQFVRYTDLWFDDGNAVVCALAESSKPGAPAQLVGFLLHKSVLASRSSFFASLLQDDAATEKQAPVGTVPTLELQDKFEDVRDLMLMLYGLLEIRHWEDDFNPMDVVSGPLGLAIKYGMQADAKRLAGILENYWPDDYELWVRKEALARLNKEQDDIEDRYEDFDDAGYNGKSPGGYWMHPGWGGDDDLEDNPYMFHNGHANDVASAGSADTTSQDSDSTLSQIDPVSLLLFAEQHEIGKLLRAAWYELTRCNASGPVALSQPASSSRPSFDLGRLNVDQQKRLLVGRERLHDLAMSKLAALNTVVSKRYSGGPAAVRTKINCCCTKLLGGWWENVQAADGFLDVVRDPLGLLAQLQRELRKDACPGAKNGNNPRRCAREWLSVQFGIAGEDIWDSLPGIFGFKVDSD